METFSFIKNSVAKEKLAGSLDRIERAYSELFCGYSLTADDVLNDIVRVENYNGLISVRDINFYSFCEHHFAPFFGKANVIYEPKNIITGLGKIVRLVRDVHGRRLQIQELMTRDIANDIERVLEVKGVFVKTTAKHLCMCSRGPSDDTAATTVTYGLGTLAGWVHEIGNSNVDKEDSSF